MLVFRVAVTGGGDQHRPSRGAEAAVPQDQDGGHQPHSLRSHPPDPQRGVHGLPLPEHHCGRLALRRPGPGPGAPEQSSAINYVPGVSFQGSQIASRQGWSVGSIKIVERETKLMDKWPSLCALTPCSLKESTALS